MTRQVFGGVFNRKDESCDEAYEFPEKIFQFYGIFSRQRERNGLTPLIFIYKWFNLMCPMMYVFFAINAMQNDGNVNKIFESMCGISASLNCGVKVLAYYSNTKEIMQLKKMAIEDLNKYMRDGSCMENAHAMKYLRVMNIITKYITIIYFVCGVMFNVLPIIFYLFNIPGDDWMLPLTQRIFYVNSKAHPGYEINFVYSAYCVNNICMMLAACDLTLMHLCFYVFIQLTICKSYCQEIGFASAGKSRDQQYAHLRKCIILFTKIFIFVKDVARIFIWAIFMQCIVSVLELTSTISYLKYSVFNSYGLLGSIIIELFGYCWMGQMILDMSNNVSESVYSSNWRLSLHDRKMSRAFLFFLKHSQVRNELSAFGLVKLSFSLLMQVMRTTFSYVAFLKNVTK